ncbi:MAG: amylo-alpha-1,6-glucosidase [Polyangiaceae bacterium]
MSVAPLSRPMVEDDTFWPSVRVDGALERAKVEWLHTNGTGSYASSTIAQLHTRRYHGLLVAALEPPLRRHVILSHVDVSVEVGANRHSLDTHQFPNVEPTGGYRLLTRFDQDPLPRWTWNLPSGVFEQTLGLVRGQNAVVMRYLWKGPFPVEVKLRPLLAMRPFHQLVREHGSMVHSVELRQGEVRVRPVPSLPRVVFGHDATFVGSPDWWRRFEYLVEQERGLDFQEDLWTPGIFTVRLLPNTASYLVAAIDQLPKGHAPDLLVQTARAISDRDPGPSYSRTRRVLSVSRTAFVTSEVENPVIIAGYPWFESWGRDSLIALPGLLLVHRDADVAARILRTLIANMEDGLVPNRIPDEGKAFDYHAADATLWLFEAARLYAEQVGANDPFLKTELVPALIAAFRAIEKGTRHNIHLTAEGLIAAADPGFALTWMDAKVDGHAVSPRAGLPIELQALWTRACDTMATLAAAQGNAKLAIVAKDAHARALFSFRRRFWCESTGYPYDVIPESPQDHASADASIRPNAVVALAVEPRLFDSQQAASILAIAERELVTPYGLRTLSPRHTNYRGRYRGDVRERDDAYHSGTAWPFLLGFYVRAVMRQKPRDPATRDALEKLVETAASNALALGHVPQLADGDPPHYPGGSVAQAFSVAELSRALFWDLA